MVWNISAAHSAYNTVITFLTNFPGWECHSLKQKLTSGKLSIFLWLLYILSFFFLPYWNATNLKSSYCLYQNYSAMYHKYIYFFNYIGITVEPLIGEFRIWVLIYKEDADSRTSINCSKNKSEVSASYSVSGSEFLTGIFCGFSCPLCS